MVLPTSEDDRIIVEFIDDQSVVHVIKDETIQKNCSKTPTRTPKHIISTTRNPESSIKRKKQQQNLNDSSNDEEYSEDESDVLLKPKSLFENGDVPGNRMFSFQPKQKQTPTIQKTPSKKMTKNGKSRHDSNKDDQEICKVRPQVLFEKSETDSKIQKKSTRATSKLDKPQAENELLDSDSQSLNGYETPKKSKKYHTINDSKIKDILPSVNVKTPKTPKSDKYIHANKKSAKTPRVVRKQIAEGIKQQKIEQLNELNDSDYSINNSSGSNESDSDSSVHSIVKPIQPKLIDTNISLRRSTRQKEVSYIYKSEEYFLSKSVKSLKKAKTSDNTLKLLKNPALDQGQVDKLSKHSNVTHDERFKDLYKKTVSNFPHWLNLLKEGFNLLLHGFGSKRQIINEFRTSMLKQESVLVINGFFPGLTLKEILESITIGLLDLDSCPGTAEHAVQQIEETQKLKNSEHIYILIHNLDGVELQNYKTQHVISRICSLKNVHLVASIDRVNAALMFDNTKLGDYNFIWMNCTNYLPYTVETRFIESLMVKNTGSTHALSGLNNFFKSLTANAKRILLLLIKNRIENKNNKKYGGVPFSTLYSWCRQQFLASTDLALRSQLVEFVDHEVIKWKRDSDVLLISVEIDVLIQFYKQNEEDDD